MRTGQTQALPPRPAVADPVPLVWKTGGRTPATGFAPSILDDLQALLDTRSADVMLFPGGANAAWEAAVAATLSPGDRVLVVRTGQVAADWALMAGRIGLEVEVIDRPWGAPAPVAEIARRLGADRYGAIKAVFVAQSDPAISDLAGLRRAIDTAFHDALLFVDGSGVRGSGAVRMDACCIDAAVSESHPGLACAPGLGILGLSALALAAKPAALRPVAV